MKLYKNMLITVPMLEAKGCCPRGIQRFTDMFGLLGAHVTLENLHRWIAGPGHFHDLDFVLSGVDSLKLWDFYTPLKDAVIDSGVSGDEYWRRMGEAAKQAVTLFWEILPESEV